MLSHKLPRPNRQLTFRCLQFVLEWNVLLSAHGLLSIAVFGLYIFFAREQIYNLIICIWLSRWLWPQKTKKKGEKSLQPFFPTHFKYNRCLNLSNVAWFYSNLNITLSCQFQFQWPWLISKPQKPNLKFGFLSNLAWLWPMLSLKCWYHFFLTLILFEHFTGVRNHWCQKYQTKVVLWANSVTNTVMVMSSNYVVNDENWHACTAHQNLSIFLMPYLSMNLCDDIGSKNAHCVDMSVVALLLTLLFNVVHALLFTLR